MRDEFAVGCIVPDDEFVWDSTPHQIVNYYNERPSRAWLGYSWLCVMERGEYIRILGRVCSVFDIVAATAAGEGLLGRDF